MKLFRKTLIVDDDPACRFLTRMALEEVDLSEEIIELPHGKAALDYIISHCRGTQAISQCPDWIILDLNMPVMDGFELLNLLQQAKQTKLVQQTVTILSSSSNPKDIDQTAQYEVEAYLTNPLLMEDMVNFIERFYRHTGNQ